MVWKSTYMIKRCDLTVNSFEDEDVISSNKIDHRCWPELKAQILILVIELHRRQNGELNSYNTGNFIRYETLQKWGHPRPLFLHSKSFRTQSNTTYLLTYMTILISRRTYLNVSRMCTCVVLLHRDRNNVLLYSCQVCPCPNVII